MSNSSTLYFASPACPDSRHVRSYEVDLNDPALRLAALTGWSLELQVTVKVLLVDGGRENDQGKIF